MVMIAGGDKIHKGCTVQRGIKLTDELLLHFTYYYYILLLTLKTRREKLCKSFAQKCTRKVKVNLNSEHKQKIKFIRCIGS